MRANANKTFDFDVMIEDKFVCSLKMPYNPAFKMSSEEVEDFIISKRPSLRNRNYHIEF